MSTNLASSASPAPPNPPTVTRIRKQKQGKDTTDQVETRPVGEGSSLRTQVLKNGRRKASGISGIGTGLKGGDGFLSKLGLMNSLKRAQQAWHKQVRSKRNFWVGLFRPSGKNSDFSLAVKDYSRKLLTALQGKHFDLGPDFLSQHTKLVGHYVGNSVRNNTAYTYRSMRSLVVGIPKHSCLIDYLATTDKATYGHLVANNAGLFLVNQLPRMRQQKYPSKRGRNETKDLALQPTKRARYVKHQQQQQQQQKQQQKQKQQQQQQQQQQQKQQQKQKQHARYLPNKPGHTLDLNKMAAINVSLNAPIVVTHRKLDDDDFDESKHEKLVVHRVFTSSPTSKSVLSGGVAKHEPGRPNESAIWVDTSQVSPEMFVLYCSQRNIVGSSNLGKTMRDLRTLLEKLPRWFYTDLLEYSNMAHVDLVVLAELITSQSLLCDLNKL
jgi:type II secretory pathway pseudopilin PulG